MFRLRNPNILHSPWPWSRQNGTRCCPSCRSSRRSSSLREFAYLACLRGHLRRRPMLPGSVGRVRRPGALPLTETRCGRGARVGSCECTELSQRILFSSLHLQASSPIACPARGADNSKPRLVPPSETTQVSHQESTWSTPPTSVLLVHKQCSDAVKRSVEKILEYFRDTYPGVRILVEGHTAKDHPDFDVVVVGRCANETGPSLTRQTTGPRRTSCFRTRTSCSPLAATARCCTPRACSGRASVPPSSASRWAASASCCPSISRPFRTRWRRRSRDQSRFCTACGSSAASSTRTETAYRALLEAGRS